MKYILKIIIFSILLSCNNSIVKGSNIIGNWENTLSKNMGGYQISSKSILSIYKTNNGEFRYSFKTYVSDKMYGSNDKLMEDGTGLLSKEVSDKKWKFSTGILSEKGSFIIVPENNWESYYPTQIEIGHGYQRGSNQIFNKR